MKEKGLVCLNLEDCIENVRSLLREHHEYLRSNEMATRIVVIDPVLTALGWNVRSPESVKLEHKHNGSKIDYVLMEGDGSVLAVVEAKPSDSALDKDRKQASGYAAEVAARYAILTNGWRWEAWEMVSSKPRNDNVIVETNLATGDVAKIASKLRELDREVLGK